MRERGVVRERRGKKRCKKWTPSKFIPRSCLRLVFPRRRPQTRASMEDDPRIKKKGDVTVNTGQKPPHEEWVSEQVTAAHTWGSLLRGISVLTMEHNSCLRYESQGRWKIYLPTPPAGVG